MALYPAVPDGAQVRLHRQEQESGSTSPIQCVSRLNSQHGGQEGWRLQGRFAAALRMLAQKVEEWQKDGRSGLREREEVLGGGCWGNPHLLATQAIEGT